MKIYSDKLTAADVSRAFSEAYVADGQDIHLDGPARNFRPRIAGYSNGIECFAKSWHGTRASAHRAIGSYPLSLAQGSDVERAASWSAYGYVMARLFIQDPDAKIGWYDGVRDFVAKVLQDGARRRESTAFLDLLPEAVRA